MPMQCLICTNNNLTLNSNFRNIKQYTFLLFLNTLNLIYIANARDRDHQSLYLYGLTHKTWRFKAIRKSKCPLKCKRP
jgi:hypothetical protein